MPERPWDLVSVERPMLGGRVGIHVRPGDGDHPAAARDASAVLDRIEAWAARLTRFDSASELSRLNAATGSTVVIGPTLAAVLDWGRAAEVVTEGIVDIALLEARLAAEAGPEAEGQAIGTRLVSAPRPLAATRRWSIARGARRSVVRRGPDIHLDLDGVAKGWLADRAADRLLAYPAVAVDADGDVAIRLDPGEVIELGVADPEARAMDVAVLRLVGDGPGRLELGVATSGVSVHRWGSGDSARHHLIDPRTGSPARTDVVQATIVATSARLAEAFAKAAVIEGAGDGLTALHRPGVLGGLLLTGDRRLISLAGIERFVA